MTDEPEYLSLKWGTLKGWQANSDAMRSALRTYFDAGPHNISAMAQHDTDAQKDALCGVIDACDGEIWNDWSGETMTKEAAKTYVREYAR